MRRVAAASLGSGSPGMISARYSALPRLRVGGSQRLIRPHQLRAREGGEDDGLVVPSVGGLVLGAPLAHSNAVAVAVTVGEADVWAVVDGFAEAAGELDAGA